MFRSLVLVACSLLLHACSYLPFMDDDEDGNAEAEQVTESLVPVVVQGVDEPVALNIKVHVGVSKNQCTTKLELLKRRQEKTRGEIVKALQAYGYYLAEFDIRYAQQEGCPVVEILVEPKERMLVQEVSIDIEGPAANDTDFNSKLADLPVRQGEPLNHGDYRRSKTRIESVAAELGYLDGQFVESKLIIDMQNYEARVRLQYQSGERYLLGAISVRQDPLFLEEELVNRLIEVPEDRHYATGKLMAMQNRLLSSDYFRTVDVKPLFNNSKDKQVPVEVALTPSDKHKFSASAGFATDEGLRSRLGYTNRRFNEKGHQLGVETKLSQSEMGGNAYYRIPREHPSNEWLRFTTGFRQQDFDTYETLSAKLTISETKRRFWGILEDHFIMLSREDFEIGNERGVSVLLIPGVSWDKRVVDDEVNTRHGINVSLDLRGAAESLFSDTSFFASRVHLHYLKAMPFDTRVIARTDLGWLWADQFRVLPPSERFFAGGDNSLRGYDFESLGPVNEQGFVIGGRYLTVVSLELEKYVTEKWGVAAFVDSGNAFGGPGSDTGIKTGVGMGIRWRSPVGPVRVDLAHPLDLDDTWFRLHLRIGPDL